MPVAVVERDGTRSTGGFSENWLETREFGVQALSLWRTVCHAEGPACGDHGPEGGMILCAKATKKVLQA